jgi:hypothetical protein
MNEKQIKRSIEDNQGERLIDVARRMAKEFGVTEGSAETMLRDLVAGRRYFPVYAKWLEQNYQVTVIVPPAYQSARRRMKLQAA